MPFFLLAVFLVASCTSGLTIKPANSNNRLRPIVHSTSKSRCLKHGSMARTASVDPIADPLSSLTPSLSLYGRYLNWIDTSPLVAKSVTAAVVGCLGDVLAQWLEGKTRTSRTILMFDWVRFNAFFVSGLFFVGPFLHCKLPAL